MKHFFSYLLLLLATVTYSQTQTIPPNATSSAFVSYKGYLEMKRNPTMKIDSIGFFIRDLDTLIRISGFNQNKGVKVEYEPKDSIFLKRYKSLVFNASNGRANDIKNNRMRYWKEEVKVYLDSTIPNKVARKMKELFRFLDKEIDSLQITTVNRKEKANCFIYFLNNPEDINWDNRIKDPSDGAFLSWNGKQHIYNVSIKVNTQLNFNEDQQIMLLKKHFIWSLGYFIPQADEKCSSFFSNCASRDKVLSNEDLEILKYHYSYGICKGTDLETFEENHKSAQKTLSKGPNNKHFFTHL